MTFKILAPALATMLLAGTAYAQSPSAQDPASRTDCKVGDLNCPTPMNQSNEAPVGTGRSATEVGTPSGAPADSGIGAGSGTMGSGTAGEGTPAQRNSPAAQQTNPMVEPNDQDSSNSGGGSGSGSSQ